MTEIIFALIEKGSEFSVISPKDLSLFLEKAQGIDRKNTFDQCIDIFKVFYKSEGIKITKMIGIPYDTQ
jgi:hypothetical protein